MIRTFVALLIPGDWSEYLAGISRDLAPRTSGLSWVRPENVHLTLRFLGDLGDSGVKRAGEAVRRGAADIAAFEARLGELGAFPNLARPRVLWVGLDAGGVAATALAEAVNAALRADGFGPEDKPFRAHLTLARVRDGARGLDALRDYRPAPPPPPALLDRVVVMKSDLQPTGSRYTPLLEVRLRR